jgi:hypothetical protein
LAVVGHGVEQFLDVVVEDAPEAVASDAGKNPVAVEGVVAGDGGGGVAGGGEVVEVAEDEAVEGGGVASGGEVDLVGEAGEGFGGLVLRSFEAAVVAGSSVAHSQLPHAVADFDFGACSPGSSPAEGRRRPRWSRLRKEAEVLEADAAGIVGAAGDALAVGEWAVGEFPGDAMQNLASSQWASSISPTSK